MKHLFSQLRNRNLRHKGIALLTALPLFAGTVLTVAAQTTVNAAGISPAEAAAQPAPAAERPAAADISSLSAIPEEDIRVDDLRTEDGAYLAGSVQTAEDVTEKLYENVPVLQFRVSDLTPQVQTDLDYVDWWYCPWEDAHYLFLPATADRTHLTVSYKASGTLRLGDTVVPNGTPTDLLSKADTFSVRAGTTDCGELRIMQSDRNILFMETGHGTLDYMDCHSTYTETAKSLFLTPDGGVEYSGDIEKITRHGNSSWDYSVLCEESGLVNGYNNLYREAKRPYNIKLPEKTKLYGMGKAKKWALLGNKLDFSMLRNTTAEAMSKACGMDFTMQSAFVDVYAGGSYRGTYQLYERVQIQKHRVNITDMEEETEKLNSKDLGEYEEISVNGPIKGCDADSYRYYDIPKNPADITGGYLVQFQLYNRYSSSRSDRSGFVTSRGQCVQLVSPEYATKAQVEYIRNFMQELEDALYSDTGYNSKGRHYSDYLDIDSTLLGYLLREISCDGDGQWTSFFFWKDSDLAGDGKLHCGPTWDYDLAFCNYTKVITDWTGNFLDEKGNYRKYYSGATNELFVFHQAINTYSYVDPDDPSKGLIVPNAAPLGWMGTLYLKEEKRLAELYYEKLDGFIEQLYDQSQENGSLIDQWGEDMRIAGEINRIRWHNYGKKPWKVLGPYNGESYEAAVEFLRSFIERRTEYLRGLWEQPAASALSDRLAAEKAALPLTRYDAKGLVDLAKALVHGQETIMSASLYPDAQQAFEEAKAALAAIPMREIPGDFNDDEAVDLKDAQAMLMHYAARLAELPAAELNPTQLRNGDVDKNGRIDSLDAMYILRCVNYRLIGIEFDFKTLGPADDPAA